MKKKNDWEDIAWKEDFKQASKEWGVPLPEPKPKKPLLFRLKIKCANKYGYGEYFTAFSKILLIVAIVGSISGLGVWGGIRQWQWHDEVVWGIKVNHRTIKTPYRFISTSNPYMDFYEEGDKVPYIVRKRIMKNPKPWMESHDSRHLGWDYSNGPVRLDLEEIEKNMNGM